MNLPTNKSFGLTFGTVFLIVFFYVFIEYDNSNLYLSILFISIIFYLLGFLNSKILYPLNFIWFKFGIFLGKIVSPIILGIIYFLVVTPTGIVMKIFKKDLLALKFTDKNSYWIKSKETKSKMKNQF
tara:strand:- start:464 stop:844 length:381 start_codon:yes stop_codon:yes gene_type:complete